MEAVSSSPEDEWVRAATAPKQEWRRFVMQLFVVRAIILVTLGIALYGILNHLGEVDLVSFAPFLLFGLPPWALIGLHARGHFQTSRWYAAEKAYRNCITAESRKPGIAVVWLSYNPGKGNFMAGKVWCTAEIGKSGVRYYVAKGSSRKRVAELFGRKGRDMHQSIGALVQSF